MMPVSTSSARSRCIVAATGSLEHGAQEELQGARRNDTRQSCALASVSGMRAEAWGERSASVIA